MIMRRQYVKPDMEVLKISMPELLAGSNLTLDIGDGTLDASESLAPELEIDAEY